MSEFKYACPVCGQHIKCDSSQAGTVMDCPTCFQKITVPQAPAGADQKFILTGSKVEGKKPPTLAEAASSKIPAPVKEFPAAAALVLTLVCLTAGALVYYFIYARSTWKTTDIGKVGVPGTSSQQEATFKIAGAGADIWSSADAFHFVSQSEHGDFSLTTHVVGLQDTNPWAKAGLMVRESFAPDSPNAMICVTASNGVAFQARTNAGAQTVSIRNVARLRAPCWLRLTRHGDALTAELSANGKTWKPAGSATMSLKKGVQAGLAVCSHNSATLCRATFDHVAIDFASAQIVPSPAVAATNAAPRPEPPKLVAPPANDTNWMLVLGTNAIPDSPVAGRIHAQDFILGRASFQNGSLTLRIGSHGPVELDASINFSGAQAEELSGNTINVMTNAEKAAKVTLRWKDDGGKLQKTEFDTGYALRLQFGTLANNRLPGKIYLCLPDPEKSYLFGSFNANANKPKPKQEPKAPPKS